MNFKKLALATAVASVPVSGMAMEPMADEALSGVTGQDGITISLASDVSAGVKIHDTDGHATTPNSGAIVLSGFAITRALGTDKIDIAIDADGGPAATPAPYLNINVSLPNNLTVDLGQLGVADSGRSGTSTDPWTTTNTVSSVVNLGSMTLGATTLNIQLGNEPQGNMVSLSTTITGGISIAGFAVNDATSNGGMTTNLSVVDNGGTDLTLNTGIDISDGTGDLTQVGVVIGLAGVGGATGIDVRMADFNVGGGGDIGDIEIIGLDLTGDMVISGH